MKNGDLKKQDIGYAVIILVSLFDSIEVQIMKRKELVRSKYKLLTLLVLLSAPFILFDDVLLSKDLLKVPVASAEAQYGILGQMAPELEPLDWIDGNGYKTESIRLSDFRGKVVYLYFFQDW